MKQLYTILSLILICLGMHAQAGSSSLQERPAPAIDSIVAEATPGAEVFADATGETEPATEPVVDGYVAGEGLKADDVSIHTITMDPELNINVFGTFSVAVELNYVDNEVSINSVTLTTKNVTNATDVFNWNYFTDGTAATNDPIVKTNPTVVDKAYTFGGIRPDDIYPEIHFASSDITHEYQPENELVNAENKQLMHFTNPFEVPANTSFFIEFYAEPFNNNPPPSQPLEVYLVGSVTSNTFTTEAWKDEAALVGSIDRDAVFDHEHSAYSKHHLIRLSASAQNTVQGIDVGSDFWIVLSSNTSDQRRSWNLKYHNDYDSSETPCDNNGTWFKEDGTGTVTEQTGCPDAHIHMARDNNLATVDGLKHTVEVEYTKNSDNLTMTDYKYIYFGEIDRLAPNPSSFIGPDPGSYPGIVTMSWNEATDPNNNTVTYNLSLVDVSDNTTVLLENFASDLETTSFEFNTAEFVTDNVSLGNGPYEILAEACDVVEGGDNLCTTFFLYDIYSAEEDQEAEFVIANIFKWAGTNTVWEIPGNWQSGDAYTYQNVFPGENDEVVVPGGLEKWPVISGTSTANTKTLTIETGAKVTIASDGKLTILEDLTNSAGASDLIIESGGSLINNTSGVQATVENQIDGGGTWGEKTTAWYYIAAPVVDRDIDNAMGDAFGGTPGAGDFDLYRWSEADDLWINYHNTVSPTFDRSDFKSGEGYIFGAPASVTLSLSGTLGSGDAQWDNLTNNGTGSGGVEGEDGYYTAGWHLLGNPYPSGIVATDTWTITNIVHTPKVWNGTSQSYEDVPEGFIPANTAFFMQVEEGSGGSNTLTIPFTARAHEAPGTKSSPQNRILLVAQAEGSTMRQQSIIRLESDVAEGFDPRYDSRFMPGYAPQLFSTTNNDRLSTRTVPEINPDLVIPFSFIRNDEGSEFKIALEESTEDADLYLVDLLADVEHQLTIEEPYIFTSSDDDPEERFELRFAPADDPTSVDPPEETTNDVRIYVLDNILHLEFTDFVSNARLQLIDTEGRLAMAESLDNGNHLTIPLNVTPGVYIVRIIRGEGLITKKVAVK